MQLVGDTIVGHGFRHRIAEDNLAIVDCSRVVVEHGLHVGIEQPLDFRQCINQLQCQVSGLILYLLPRRDGLAFLAKLKAIGYLSCQRLKQLFHVDANVVRTDSLMALSLVEVVRKDDALYQVDDFLHLLHRGE